MPAIRHACPIPGCRKTCSRPKDVERHLDTHNELSKTRWACPVGDCDKTTRQKSNMVSHIRKVHHTTIPPIRRLPSSKALRTGMKPSRSVEGDNIPSIAVVKPQVDVFSIAPTKGISYASPQIEYQQWNGYLSNADVHSFDSVPSLSPSTSFSDFSSPHFWPSTPSPTLDHNFATASIETPSFDYGTVPQPTLAPYYNFDLMYPQVVSGPFFDINVACPDLKPTISSQQEPYNLQNGNNAPVTLIPAHGLPSLLVDSQSELRNTSSFDLSFAASLAYSTNDGLNDGNLSSEYDSVISVPPVYPDAADELSGGKFFVPSLNPADYPDIDINYLNPNWDATVSMDDLVAFNYL